MFLETKVTFHCLFFSLSAPSGLEGLGFLCVLSGGMLWLRALLSCCQSGAETLFRRFNDISIRSKLIVIVSGAVALLTTAVLISVGLSANKQVTDDVRQELEDGRTQFSLNEGEHLHGHALEAKAIASDDGLVSVVER